MAYDPFNCEAPQDFWTSLRTIDQMRAGEVAAFSLDAAFMTHRNGNLQLYLDGQALYEPATPARTDPDQIVVGRIALNEVYPCADDAASTYIVDLGRFSLRDVPRQSIGYSLDPKMVAAHTEPNTRFKRNGRHAMGGLLYPAVRLLMDHADGRTKSGLHLSNRRYLGDRR